MTSAHEDPENTFAFSIANVFAMRPSEAACISVALIALAVPARAESNRVIPEGRAPQRGDFMVQIAAQRSEEDVHTTFQALQAKYPAVLGGLQILLREVNVGDQGIYHMGRIGPFRSVEGAQAFCDSLRDAGGQCIVMKELMR